MKLMMTLCAPLVAITLIGSSALAAEHQMAGQTSTGCPGQQEQAPGQPPMMGRGMMGQGCMGMMCPMMGMMPMMQQMMGCQMDPGGMGMMGMMRGSKTDPKAMGRMLEMRGEMLKAVGEVLIKHGKAMAEEGK